MKKKIYLKKWVKCVDIVFDNLNVVLGIIMIIAMLVMMSEQKDTITFIVSHLVAMGIFILCGLVIVENSR